jgi:hypothetical protein
LVTVQYDHPAAGQIESDQLSARLFSEQSKRRERVQRVQFKHNQIGFEGHKVCLDVGSECVDVSHTQYSTAPQADRHAVDENRVAQENNKRSFAHLRLQSIQAICRYTLGYLILPRQQDRVQSLESPGGMKKERSEDRSWREKS